MTETRTAPDRIVADYIAPNGTHVVAVLVAGQNYVVRTSKALVTTIYLGSQRITKRADINLWHRVYDTAHPMIVETPAQVDALLDEVDARADAVEAERVEHEQTQAAVDSDDFPAPGPLGACADKHTLPLKAYDL